MRNRGSGQGINDLTLAKAEYIDWFDRRRLHGEIENQQKYRRLGSFKHKSPSDPGKRGPRNRSGSKREVQDGSLTRDFHHE
jgi:hypothetical protein